MGTNYRRRSLPTSDCRVVRVGRYRVKNRRLNGFLIGEYFFGGVSFKKRFPRFFTISLLFFHSLKYHLIDNNLGEVYNLTISRGTLTPEDRFKINEHMISGIRMLGVVPLPSECITLQPTMRR
ncbi:hypothetical protein VCRA2120O333_40062 [Vibrio crassostreae]|nr:hypothetical protein VCRA2121O334_40296 [Vibrio crassostreae]CAK3517388.1 hypothetical protein VCRA2122O341_30022 [Vibrio crassostreae]CAK3913657.1 hypothetical protein VCRA2120O333_40062 [Vibrio crassostreae]